MLYENDPWIEKMKAAGVRKELYTRESGYKAIRAMFELSEQARKNGVADMSLDEINAEIAAARAEIDAIEKARLQGGVEEDPCEIPNEVTLQVLEDAEKGIHMNGPFNTIDEMMDALNS